MFKYWKVTFFFAGVLFLFANSASAQTIIYVENLSPKTSEKELNAVFAKYGDVVSLEIIKDRVTGQPKGIAFVTMSDPTAAQIAIKSINGREINVRGITVRLAEQKPTKIEGRWEDGKSQVPSAKPTEKPKEPPTAPKTEPTKPDEPKETVEPEDEAETVRLYIGNLSLETTEESLEEAFEEAGEVISVSIEKDTKGKSKGFGYIEMSAEDAGNAISTLNNSELDGKKIVVKKAEPNKEN